jgi:hypothetical protein
MEVLMKRALMGLLAGLMLGSVAYGHGLDDDSVIERPFSEDGTVRLKLSSGDYTVRAGWSDRIVIRWHANDASHVTDMKKIRVSAELSGNVATIRTEGPTNRARFMIEIPGLSDVYLRMRAGDVRIDGIEGNKDVRMTAGDLRIQVVPATLWRAHASVRFGDLRARPLGISRDGIGNSLDWIGAGKYTLHASLFAGDLTLHARAAVR